MYYFNFVNGDELTIVDRGHCNFCKQRSYELCKVEKPEWFTKKRTEPKSGFESRIESFVSQRTELRKCVSFNCEENYSDEDYYTGSSTEQFLVCHEHLGQFMDKLE